MLPFVHNWKNEVDVKAFATLEQRLFCHRFSGHRFSGKEEKESSRHLIHDVNKGTVIPAKWTKAYFLFCLGLALQAVTRRFFRWLKGLERSPTSRRRERIVLETWISRRKIDYENRFEELEKKELSKRFYSSCSFIFERRKSRWKKKEKKIGNLYLVMIYTCTIYYVFNVTNDHCTVNEID